MTDQRATTVQRYRAEQKAQAVYILTTVMPFSVSQNRAIVVFDGGSMGHLITCSGCTPRTALGQGVMRDIPPDVLNTFLAALEDAAAAWDNDAIPPNVHDGVTITVERVNDSGYMRVRIVEPQPDTPHHHLIAAWTQAFPEVRQMLR